MRVDRVASTEDERAFLDVPEALHGSDESFVRVPDSELRAIFDTKKNALFAEGALAARFVMRDDDGALLGRIAAFRQTPHTTRDGGIGFFACIDDVNAARLLFHAAESFLRESGALKIEGPTNFGERDRFCGVLSEGEGLPLYLENHNPLYYASLFEKNGYAQAFASHTYLADFDVSEPTAMRLHRIRELARVRPSNCTTRTFGPNDGAQLIPAFLHVYEAAFSRKGGTLALNRERVEALLETHRDLIVPGLVWIAYVDEEPAGMCVFLPDANELFAKAKSDGSMRSPSRAKGIAFAVHPKYQKQSIAAVMALSLHEAIEAGLPYRKLYLTGVSSYSDRMRGFVTEVLRASVDRVHVTFSKTLSERA